MPASFDPAAAPAAPSVDADAITNRTFSSSFRGWDPDEVRVHLVAVADSVRALVRHQQELDRRLAEATAAARRANTAELDVAEVAAILGEETARVLSAAREAAAEIEAKANERAREVLVEADTDASGVRARADAEASELRRRAQEEAAATRAAGEEHVAGWRANAEAEIEAQREAAEAELAEQRQAAREEGALIRAEADEAAARVREEADEAAQRLREEADAYQARVRTDADVYAERVHAEAEAAVAARMAEVEVECARLLDEATLAATEHRHAAAVELSEAQTRATSLVDEAQLVRDRVLADLAKRRKAARQHLEQLRAARDRLLSAYDVVKGTVEEATRELTVVLPEAKRAADEAARRVAAEPEPTVEQLEAELTVARDAGLPIIAEVASRGHEDVAGSGELDEVDESEHRSAAEVLDAPVVAPPADTEAAAMASDATAPAATDGVAPAPDETAAAPAGADQVAEPTAPVPPPPPPSSVDLRALREAKDRKHKGLRRRRDPLGGEDLPGGPLEAVDVSAEFEVVRVIETGEVPAVPPEAVAASDAVADGDPKAEPPKADAAKVAAPKVDAAGSEEPKPPRDAAAELTAAEALAAEEAASDDAAAAPDVDALFARLRAERPAGDGAADAKPSKANGTKPEPAKSEPAKVDAAKPEPAKAPAATAPAAKPEPAAAPTDEPAKPEPAKSERAKSEPAKEPAATRSPAPASAAKAKSEAGIDQDAAEAASLLERRDGVLADIEQRLAKRLKRVLSDEQSALLDEVRRSRRGPVAADVLPDADAQLAAYADAALAELRSAAVAGARFAGDVEDQARAESTTDVEPIAREVAEAFAGPLRHRIERALSEDPAPAAEGASADPVDELELADRLRSCYREWRSQRLGDVVADGVLAAFSRAMVEAMPSGADLRWMVDQADAPCADCGDNALAPGVVQGEEFPTGHRFPPAHPGCRCIVLPAAMVTETGVRANRRSGSRR